MSTQPVLLDPTHLVPAQHARQSGFKLSLFSGSGALSALKGKNNEMMYEYSESGCSSAVQEDKLD